MDYDEKYMRRALQLAARSPYDTHSNPMVGAVIVDHDGRVIGEGYHRRRGEGHAEVNAIASVADKALLRDATMYVTLEPCSHYGKTPPCAKLIIDKNIPRVVVGAVDPFEKVSGRGIAMLREAGIETVEGVLADESRRLNRRFFTAHTRRRPFITLKWAQSADRFMDRRRAADESAARFSNPSTTMLTHRLRSEHDAILTSAATVIADNPRLDVRAWDGPSPRRVVLDLGGRLDAAADYHIFADGERKTMLYRPDSLGLPAEEWVRADREMSLEDIMSDLYSRGITSVLVEAGPRLLQSFIDAGLWDTIRIETSPQALGDDGAHPSPQLSFSSANVTAVDGNTIEIIDNPDA